MVYSASADIASQNGGSPTAYLIKQALYVVMGIMVVWFMMAINIKILQSPRFLVIFAAVQLGALLFVKLFGQAVNGAQGWINLGVINIQPAEVCKVFLILYLARMLSQRENQLSTAFFSSAGGPLLLSFVLVGLILIQPDLGGAVINGAIIMIMVLASGISWKKKALLQFFQLSLDSSS